MAGASTVVSAGALCGMSGCENGMKYRTLGRTKIRASVINSDELPEKHLYRLAIEAGVNYWHKMGRWGEPEIFTALDRDSFTCDLTIDSVEKDGAIEEFERGLKRSGLSMIDGFKVHSVYDNPEDIQKKTGIFQAFETLKKRGKTRFLMLSQHRNVVDVAEAAIESDRFDVLQLPIHPLMPHDYFVKDSKFPQHSSDRYLALIKNASDKGIGVTSMKTVVGGPKNWEKIPDFEEKIRKYLPETEDITTALIHWTLNVPGVKTFASSMKSHEMFYSNMRAAGGELSEREARGVQHFAALMNCSVCRMCGACERAHPGGVAVSDILRYSMYYSSYGLPQKARRLYAALPRTSRIDSKADPGRYERSCPYGLPVTEHNMKH